MLKSTLGLLILLVLVLGGILLLGLLLWWLLSGRKERAAAEPEIEVEVAPSKAEAKVPDAVRKAALPAVAAEPPMVVVALPEVAVALPEAELAEAKLPKVELPEVELPEAELPKVELPEVEFAPPAVMTPELALEAEPPTVEPERVDFPGLAEPAVAEAAVEVPLPQVGRGAPEVEFGVMPSGPDDLKVIEGIGPKIASVLQAAGITTFAQLAGTEAGRLRQILETADPRLLRLADPTTWPEQARLAADGAWEALQELQGSLRGGRQAG